VGANKLKAAIFDMDGVLIDSEPVHLEACNRILARHGSELSHEENRSYLGWNESSFWAAMVKRFSLPGTVEEYTSERARLLTQLLTEHLPLAPGIQGFLDQLTSRGLKLGVASSSDRQLILFVLRRGGIDRFFDAVAAGDEVTHRKPDPEIFLLTAHRLSVEPESCIVFEDSPVGARGAIAAGMRCCRVTSPTTSGLVFPAVDHVVESFSDLTIDEILDFDQ